MACWTADLSSLLTAASSLLGPLCRAAQCRWLYQSKQANIREREQAGRQASPSSVTYSWKWPPITSAASSWGVSSATLREFHASVALGCLHRSLHTAHAQAGFFVTCGVHMWKTGNGLWLYLSVFPSQPELLCGLLSPVAAVLMLFWAYFSAPHWCTKNWFERGTWQPWEAKRNLTLQSPGVLENLLIPVLYSLHRITCIWVYKIVKSLE